MSFDRKKVKISEAINDMVAYTQLTDTVMQHIMISEDEEFDEVDNL